MVDYIEILRLSSDPKNSQRCIASIVHSSRHTIRDVLEAAKKAGISWPLDKAVTNDMLRNILFPEKFTAETLYTQPDYPYIHKELARPGVNLTFSCLSKNGPLFCRHYLPFTLFATKYGWELPMPTIP